LGESPQDVRETISILEMWSALHSSYKNLKSDEKKKVKAEISGRLSFPGFVANNEPHYGIARYLIEDLEKFPSFAQVKDLNSHFPTIDRHRRMHEKFEPLRKTLVLVHLMQTR
jgi:uncharacterized protein YfbU (UPF0304 family)